jgi:hypothetical protein
VGSFWQKGGNNNIHDFMFPVRKFRKAGQKEFPYLV